MGHSRATADVDLLSLADLGTPHIAGYSLEGKVNAAMMIHKAVCRHFDLALTEEANADFLEPGESRIEVNCDIANEEDVIRKVVHQCYDIERDDATLRALLSMKREDYAEYFARLRMEYPLRREFFNTTVVLPPTGGSLCDALTRLGFRVKYSQGSEAGICS